MSSKSSTVEIDESPVEGALRRQINLLSSLNCVVSNVEERFHFALRPAEPEAGKAVSDERMNSSPLVDNIDDNNEALGRVIMRLERLLARSTI